MTEHEFEKFMKEKSGDKNFTLGVRLPDIPEQPIAEGRNSSPGKNGSKSQRKSSAGKSAGDSTSDMWTDRYKPRQFRDLVGNSGVIGQLYEWLKDWDEVCLRGNKKQLPFQRGTSW